MTSTLFLASLRRQVDSCVGHDAWAIIQTAYRTVTKDSSESDSFGGVPTIWCTATYRMQQRFGILALNCHSVWFNVNYKFKNAARRNLTNPCFVHGGNQPEIETISLIPDVLRQAVTKFCTFISRVQPGQIVTIWNNNNKKRKASGVIFALIFTSDARFLPTKPPWHQPRCMLVQTRCALPDLTGFSRFRAGDRTIAYSACQTAYNQL